jgi:hypothetical protein
MADIPEPIQRAEKLEMDLMRKGKSHAEAERQEKRVLNRPGSGSMFSGLRNLQRGGKR